MDNISNITEQRISELQRLIEKFQSDFKNGTSDPENFMTMSDIENLWSNLRNSTDKIYSDMVMELMSEVDEKKLISKKNKNSKNAE